MANEQEERVSALADGELDPRHLDALLARMREDDSLRARWAHYHLISDALHNNLTRGTQLDISQRVSAALDNEPVVFAPIWQRMRPTHRMVKHAAGVAMAASVAAVAIFGAQWMNQGIPTAPATAVATAASPAVNTMEVAALDTPANGEPAVAQTTDGTPSGDEVWIRNLDSYVVNHNEYAGNTGMHGVLPYARLVSYESQQ